MPLNVQASVNASDGYYLWQGVSPRTYRLVENWTAGENSHEVVRSVAIGLDHGGNFYG